MKFTSRKSPSGLVQSVGQTSAASQGLQLASVSTTESSFALANADRWCIRMMARGEAVSVASAAELLPNDDNFVPSKAWEGRMRCKDTNLKPFVGTLRVESPSGSA